MNNLEIVSPVTELSGNARDLCSIACGSSETLPIALNDSMRSGSPGWALGMDVVIPQNRPEKRHATPPGAVINNLIFGTWTDRSSGTHWRGIHGTNYSRSTCCHHRDRCNRVSRRSTSSYTKCDAHASQTCGLCGSFKVYCLNVFATGEKHCTWYQKKKN